MNHDGKHIGKINSYQHLTLTISDWCQAIKKTYLEHWAKQESCRNSQKSDWVASQSLYFSWLNDSNLLQLHGSSQVVQKCKIQTVSFFAQWKPTSSGWRDSQGMRAWIKITPKVYPHKVPQQNILNKLLDHSLLIISSSFFVHTQSPLVFFFIWHSKKKQKRWRKSCRFKFGVFFLETMGGNHSKFLTSQYKWVGVVHCE